MSEWARDWLEPATCSQPFWCTCASRCHTALSKELYRFRRPTRYFPSHVCVHRVHLHLWHLGLLPPAVAMLQARASALSQGHDGQVRAVTGVRCPACGLLKRHGAEMAAHIRGEHMLPDGRPRTSEAGGESFWTGKASAHHVTLAQPQSKACASSQGQVKGVQHRTGSARRVGMD